MMTIDEILKQIDKSEKAIETLSRKMAGPYGLVARSRDYYKGRVDAFREVSSFGQSDNEVVRHIEAGVLSKSKELMRCATCNRVLIFDRPDHDAFIRCACCECDTLYSPSD